MPRPASVLSVLAACAMLALALACASATSPSNLTGPYVGSYAMDSITAAQLAQEFPPHGTVDSADGVLGTLVLKPDSFYLVLTGAYAKRDSGTFSINSSDQWTLNGSWFAGTGTGAIVGNQLQLLLSGGSVLGDLYGLFPQQ
jgi:hypothetical protein